MRSAACSNPSFGCLGLFRAHDGVMRITFVQGVVRTFDKDFGPLHKTGRQKSGKHADQYFLDKRRVHPGLSSRRNAMDRGYQNPHCRVFMIQNPRSKFVSPCAKMHDDKLLVR